jgi:hypothetical protein
VSAVHVAIGVLALVLMAAAGLLGAWSWWRVRRSPMFWRLLRAAQLVTIVEVIDGGIDYLTGRHPQGLHILYGVLPLVVSLIGEQFRISAAQMVLDARGFESSADVGRLPADEQQVIVASILQREIGVMALAALVNVVLLVRAATVY